MGHPTIRFNDEAGIAPGEVRGEMNTPELQLAVDRGRRYRRLAAHREEPTLQFTARPFRLGIELIDQHPQPSHSSTTATPLDHGPHRSRIEDPQELSLRDRMS